MMVKDRDVAEDIFQETFIKAVRVIDDGRYTDNGKFLSWILRIAHNQVIDHFRAQRQNKTVTEAEAGYDVLGSLRFAERNVEDAMVSEQIERDVRALVELLPPEQREVVMMRYFSGLSFKDIAEQTDVSINTALGRMRSVKHPAGILEFPTAYITHLYEPSRNNVVVALGKGNSLFISTQDRKSVV